MKVDKKTVAIGAGIALLGYFFWPKEAKAAAAAITGGSDTADVNGMRQFTPSGREKIKALLDRSAIIEYGSRSLPQAAQLVRGANAPSALSWVLARQKAGFVVGVSSDVLSSNAIDPTMFASVLPADAKQAFSAPDGSWTVIPPL